MPANSRRSPRRAPAANFRPPAPGRNLAADLKASLGPRAKRCEVCGYRLDARGHKTQCGR